MVVVFIDLYIVYQQEEGVLCYLGFLLGYFGLKYSFVIEKYKIIDRWEIVRLCFWEFQKFVSL